MKVIAGNGVVRCFLLAVGMGLHASVAFAADFELGNTASVSLPSKAESVARVITPSSGFVLAAQSAASSEVVGFRQTSDFVFESAGAVRNRDGSLTIQGVIYNLGEAEGTLEVYDSNGALARFPSAVLGNRQIPDSVYALVVDNQWKVAAGLVTYAVGGPSPLDPRSTFQSRRTEFEVRVPRNGYLVVTKNSPYARAYNAFFLALSVIGYIDGTNATTISRRRMEAIVRVLAAESSQFVAERVVTRSGSWRDLVEFAVETTLKVVGAAVLNPDDLDGRTVLGRALKDNLLKGAPFIAQLEAVAMAGDFANWVLAFGNLRAAVFRDSSIAIRRGPVTTLLPSAPPSRSTPLTFAGWGPIRVGMPIDEAKAVAGVALVTRDDPKARDACVVYEREGLDEGMWIVAWNGRVAWIAAAKPESAATVEGVRVGDTIDKVRATYGVRLKQNKSPGGPDQIDAYTLRGVGGSSLGNVMVFSSSNGQTVLSITVGLPERTAGEQAGYPRADCP